MAHFFSQNNMALFSRKRRVQKKNRWNVSGKRKRSEKMKKWITKRKLMVMAMVVAIIALIYLVFFSKTFQIQTVIVSSEQQNMNTERIQELIAPQIVGKNMFRFGQATLLPKLYSRFKDISSIKVIRHSFHDVEIELRGFDIVALIKKDGNRYYLNENGTIVAYDERNLSLPVLELELYHPKQTEKKQTPVQMEEEKNEPTGTASIIQEKFQATEKQMVAEEAPEPKELQQGEQIIQPKELQEILLAIQEVKETTKQKINNVIYRQLPQELHVKTAQDYWVILNISANVAEQIHKLKRSLQSINPVQLKRIDVSIKGNKVFYTQK
jgi:hypothetical protein